MQNKWFSILYLNSSEQNKALKLTCLSLNERLNFLFILCLTIWKFFDFLFSLFVLPSLESFIMAPNLSRPSAPAFIVANLSSLFCFFFLLTLVIALRVIKLSLQYL